MNENRIKLTKTYTRNKTVFTEIKQEFSRKQENINKTFEFKDFIAKNECTSFFFGKEKIEQKGYICFKCDKKAKHFICDYCYNNCHEKCRKSLKKEILESLLKKEFFNLKVFSCYCGINLKHTFEEIKNIRRVSCTMMKLDQGLGIPPYHCISHNSIVCCICAVVCHNKCNVKKLDDIDDELKCECNSDYHSNFNELALSFPLEKYKKVANIDIWPIQILNILFSTKNTFSKMSLFFHRTLDNEIDFNNNNNIAIINKFEKLLALFSDAFNRKFKTYYYVEDMSNMFPFKKLLNFIKDFEVNNGQTVLIKFRLLFILLFIHLRKDFNTIKSFTSNDFYCNTVLERLKIKKMLESGNIFSYNINEKYEFNGNSPVKTFVLKGLCNLITNGMNYVSVEENQDEFEIGLKLITFMLKRMIFDKNDIILLIDSIYDFHSNFYHYIMSENNNIYSLIDIFNAIIELCFIISIYYNDLIIEEFLNSKKFDKIGQFIHNKNEHSNKLLTILLKNCDLFSKHYNILVMPHLDKKNKEEIRRENNLRKHKLAMQNQIASRTTGTTTKMPENGGLFTDKIINLFIENLAIFSLADNIYQKQLNNITNDDINNYYKFCKKIEDENFYEIMNIEKGKHHSNILYNLKIIIDEIYFDLFTSSYDKQQEILDNNLRTCILNSCDEIEHNIDEYKNKKHFQKLIRKLVRKEKKIKNNNYIMDEKESQKRRLLNEIGMSINLGKNNFLLMEEGRELIVDNLIVSQIDEILFKGLFLLSNIHYPNIITPELIELYLQFLSLFLLTKNGTIYLITGKSLQVIQRLINRFRFDEKNKNINEEKNRTMEFNIRAIKIVIHFLYNIAKFIKIYDIKTIKGHKVLMKYRKSILNHLNYFSNKINTKEKELEFKKQLKESLEIFNNLFPFYSYNEFEIIKSDIIDLFKNSKLKFLKSELFQNLFDKSILNKDPKYLKDRNCEVDYYFQFFELITKNSFYIYNNDKYGQKLINSIIEFIDIQTLEKILLNSSDMMSYSQKIVLLRFIRTFYLMDHLNQVNYLYRENPLSNKDYKLMLKRQFIKDTKITQYLKITKKHLNNSTIIKNIEYMNYIRKYEYINELIILMNIFGNQFDSFPYSIYNETNICIKNYIKELIFSVHDISNAIYDNESIANKILPYYYKLVVKFLNRKDVFLKILNDIDRDIKINDPIDYEYLVITDNRNKDYKFIINNNFIIFDKKEIFSRVIKNIFDIYNKTKINEEYSLQKYLEIYDIFNEANFPPFSLLEIKDYEYFYEEQDEKENNNKKNNNGNRNENENEINRLDIINNNFVEQFRIISNTSFLGVLTGDSIDKKFDFGLNFTQLFESFINSTESNNLKNYRTLLCIMNKMLFYDSSHIQALFREMIVDKYFFNNMHRELNYYIVKYIDSSKKYELCKICSEITDITKLTIQFLQLLGEGFNTDFHENILKQITEKRRLYKKRTLIRKGTIVDKDLQLKEENENSDYSDKEEIIINDELIEKSIQFSVKQEMNKIKNIPLVYPDDSIYETMVNNLKIIFHLMELNYIVEGELCFDKLIILSTNIIDFLIEYIDTKKTLNYIIDNNISSLFFGKGRKFKSKMHNKNYIENQGILELFTMKIKEKDKEEKNMEQSEDDEKEPDNFIKYKLRRTMLTYMKIKYFQLLKAYIQLGNKNDFVKKLIEKKLGPAQLFEEALYYMLELINNLVTKDYNKYSYLLDINSEVPYESKLINLYMNEDDFRTSIEINLIFQICIIIKIIEDIYGIVMLKEFYDKEQINDNIRNKNIKKEKKEKKENNNLEDKINDEEIKDNTEMNNINKDIYKDKNKKEIYIKNEETDNKITFYNNNITNNISNTLAPLKPKLNYLSTVYANTNENINLNKIEDNNNIITLKENPKFTGYKKEAELNKKLYKNISKNYHNYIRAKTIKENEEEITKNKKAKIKLDEDNLNLKSKFSISVYKFLFSLILKVEIQMDILSEENNFIKKINKKRLHLSKISNDISKNIINLKNFDFFLSGRNANQILDNSECEINIEKNAKKIKLLEEISEENKIAFFIKPYLSFHLSEQTKDFFINNVDRSSAKEKYKSLVIFSDYSIFEMIYNMKFINNSKIIKKLSTISFYYLHIINFLLIILENSFLMFHYYQDYSLPHEDYDVIKTSVLNKKFSDIVIIIMIKLIIIIFSFFVWFYCKFTLELQRNILFSEETSFIFRQNGEKTQNINDSNIVDYFQGNGSLYKIMEIINKDIDFFKLLKIVIFNTILFNLDICIFVLSFILNVVFLIIGHPLILSIETIFIVRIFPSLLNIFKSFTAKFSSIFSCLMFTYLVVYIYNWIAILYMRETFDFGDIYDYKTGSYISEPFCHSSIQCLLVLISYGTRAGGGVGDALPTVSYKNSTKMFIGRFIYDMTFFIFIINIMGNVTFGLIVDTFGELRDETYNNENDKNNKCFICQISRDGCLLKNIDFNSHIKYEHNLWNYVDFLVYLHLNNPNDFSRVEGIVWDKLIENDYGWIPINNEYEGGEEDNNDDD